MVSKRIVEINVAVLATMTLFPAVVVADDAFEEVERNIDGRYFRFEGIITCEPGPDARFEEGADWLEKGVPFWIDDSAGFVVHVYAPAYSTGVEKGRIDIFAGVCTLIKAVEEILEKVPPLLESTTTQFKAVLEEHVESCMIYVPQDYAAAGECILDGLP